MVFEADGHMLAFALWLTALAYIAYRIFRSKTYHDDWH